MERKVGPSTTTQLKSFAAGFTIGVAHGAANKMLAEKAKTNHLYPIATWVAAYQLAKFYNNHEGNPSNGATLWGRGLGQCCAESVGIQDGKVTFDLEPNLTLAWALYNSIFG